MKIDVSPTAALCDRKLNISVSGLPAGAQVRISLAMALPWAPDVPFRSCAQFTAGTDGRVDLASTRPDSGSYDYIDSMGLVSSLVCVDSKAISKITRGISVEKSLFFDYTVECGDQKETVRVERWLKTPDIQRELIHGNFVGEFFFSDKPGRQTLLWLGGSGSNLAINALIAAPLASRGFNVLAVPFFGEKGLPSQLSRIPLEYFERIFEWLGNDPRTAGQPVQIIGMSKGAEAALVLASRYPIIRRVALWAPHAYCFQGIAFKNESSWTYQGRDLPYIRLKNRWVFADMVRCMIQNEPFGYTHTFIKGLQEAQNRDEARIRVEDARADLLIFTGKQCNMWNTFDGCLEIMDTLERTKYPYPRELVVYEEAGEPYLVPYVIPVGINSVQILPRLVLSTGGTMHGNAQAQADTWERTIEFFSRPSGE
jgi:dienelactone hydrolase